MDRVPPKIVPTKDKPAEITNLEGMLAGLCEAGSDPETVSVADIRGHLGRRAFGPVLAVAALPSLTPVSTVPLLPSVLSVIIFLTAAQMVAGMREIWLPKRILRLSLGRARLVGIVRFVLPAARFLDRLIRPRLVALTREPAIYGVGIVCCLLALIKLPLEVVPFTSGIPAFPVLLFGLAMTARDGALIVVTLVLIAAGIAGLIFLGVRLLF
jgi:hypothetical protein